MDNNLEDVVDRHSDRWNDGLRLSNSDVHSQPPWLGWKFGFVFDDRFEVLYEWCINLAQAGSILLLATGLSSCSLPAISSATPTENIKLNLEVEVNGVKQVGLGVVNNVGRYKITPKPTVVGGEYYLSTCHRDVRFKDSYDYEPNFVEASGYCPVILTYPGADQKHGLQTFQEAFLDFGIKEDKEMTVLVCNGESRPISDVAVCQGKAGTFQDIVFASPRNFATPAAQCAGLIALSDSRVRVALPKGFCVYVFKDRVTGRATRLTTYGYESWQH